MPDPPRYEDITESTGVPLTPEGAEMLYTRYALAADAAAGRRVLELGCGAAIGFGFMGERARRLVGADFSPALLADARRHYDGRFPFVRLSAEQLPFRPQAFDLIVCFEASYYVPDMDRAFGEIARVLAPGGEVLFANANPERPDFIRSPYSTHYHSADEFRTALAREGFRVHTLAGFPMAPPHGGIATRAAARALRLLRRLLEGLGLVPRTLKGRARLKRLLYRRLPVTPAELPENFAQRREPVAVVSGPVRGYKVIYVRGDKPAGAPSPRAVQR
jgi:SAM-dependent methyltransferase